jgi:hypothetical protein
MLWEAFDSLAPASSPFGLPVYVARVPAAPFCETPILNAAADPTTDYTDITDRSARVLLQVERVVLNALAKKCGFGHRIFARTANHWPSSSGEADPHRRTNNSVRRCTKRKKLTTRLRPAVAGLRRGRRIHTRLRVGLRRGKRMNTNCFAAVKSLNRIGDRPRMPRIISRAALWSAAIRHRTDSP